MLKTLSTHGVFKGTLTGLPLSVMIYIQTTKVGLESHLDWLYSCTNLYYRIVIDQKFNKTLKRESLVALSLSHIKLVTSQNLCK